MSHKPDQEPTRTRYGYFQIYILLQREVKLGRVGLRRPEADRISAVPASVDDQLQPYSVPAVNVRSGKNLLSVLAEVAIGKAPVSTARRHRGPSADLMFMSAE